LLPLFVAQFSLMAVLGRFLPNLPQPSTLGAADLSQLQNRFTIDGIATAVAIGLGYGCFVYVSISEAKRYARVHSEIVLATEIHRVLVPTIDLQIGQFEFYGRTLPAAEVGGDLIDVIRHDRGWIAYIADVSGHGVAPGIVMAMVKSAARMQLSSGEKSARLLERLNAVLHPIKKPEMFVTFAYLAWDGELLEYSMAGHPPILHYHAASKKVSELACSNLPVGMFGGQQFESGTVEFAPDDLFLLFTDGVLEVANAADEEFGLPALQIVTAANSGKPLSAALHEILNATDRHGHPADDRSLLLVRALSSNLELRY
jgi:sigma-B regulation protein RsbU (phosphoserine phosphatase)